jgi:hypothetical protein
MIRFALLALALACGAPSEDYFDDSPDGGLGQVEQAFGAKNSTTYQYGTRSASSSLACNKTSTGQVCMLLRGVTGTVANKAVTWRFTPAHGFTAAEQTGIRNAVTALDNTLSTWTFTETTVAPSAPIQIGKGTCSGSSSSNNIDSFRCLSWALPQNLTEGAGVVGAYQSASVVIALDTTDIVARGAVEESVQPGTQGEEGKLRTHAALSGFMAAIGAGTRDDASSANTYHDRTLVFPPLSSAGADCQMESFNHFDNGAFDLVTPACAD